MNNRDMKAVQTTLKRMSKDTSIPPRIRSKLAWMHEMLKSAQMTYEELIDEAQQSPLNSDGVVDYLPDDFTN